MPNSSVIHWKCLDTLGLLDLSKAHGERAPGVRLTHGALATHVKRAKSVRHPPVVISAAAPSAAFRPAVANAPLPVADPPSIDPIAELLESTVADVAPPDASVAVDVAPVVDPVLALGESARVAVESLGGAAPEEHEGAGLASLEETLVSSSSEPRPRQPSLVTIDGGLRKPTTWAVVLLCAGVALGAGIAKRVSRAPAQAVAAVVATPVAKDDAPAAAAWPRVATSSFAHSASGADHADALAHSPTVPTRAPRSSRHHAIVATAGAQPAIAADVAAVPAPALPAVDPSADVDATRVRADAVSTSALVQKELDDSL